MIKDYNKYVNDNKLSGKYGFYSFLEIVDDMNLPFIKGDYLNVKNFNIFFKTKKIKNNIKLLNILKNKISLSYAHFMLNKLKDKNLSFYFGVRNFKLEYGFYDNFKNKIYKVGIFKVNSSYLKLLPNSHKSLVLISYTLKKTKLKILVLLQQIKNDLVNFVDDNNNNITIYENGVIKHIKKDNETDIINTMFLRWCEKHKWYKHVNCDITDDENNTNLTISLKDNINEEKDDSTFVDIIPRTIVAEPMITEPLNAPKLKINKNNKISDKKKERDKYIKDLKKTLDKIKKDMSKNKSYLTKHITSIVSKYNKKFKDVKKDLQWLNWKLNQDPNFLSD
jgi:hypothetical protein